MVALLHESFAPDLVMGVSIWPSSPLAAGHHPHKPVSIDRRRFLEYPHLLSIRSEKPLQWLPMISI
jgi:hypothetical protein